MTRPKILVIEDSPEVVKAIALILKNAGCDVTMATGGRQGLQLALDGGFDLITLDVDLPDINGFEICRRLKQTATIADTPVIFLSARCTEDDQRCGLELGAVAYLVKPFETLDFLALVLFHARGGKSGTASHHVKTT